MIGVLALQGDYAAHCAAFHRCHVTTLLITKPQQLNQVDGLVIPGGESTSLLKLMRPLSFMAAIRDFSQQKKAIFGTCAGAILLARHVEPEQQSLGLLDIAVKRNAYGRQLDSFITEEQSALSDKPMEMVFIRAPQIVSVDNNDIKILASYQRQPVLVRHQHILAATFHPELSEHAIVHEYFVKMIGRS